MFFIYISYFWNSMSDNLLQFRSRSIKMLVTVPLYKVVMCNDYGSGIKQSVSLEKSFVLNYILIQKANHHRMIKKRNSQLCYFALISPF